MTQFETEAFDEDLAPIDMLIRLSRHYGSDERYVLAGGGNTSVKTGERLFVKASGCSLAQADEGSFVELHRPALLAALDICVDTDVQEREEKFKQAILAAKINSSCELRPSVEAVLHGLLGSKFVVHTHPTLVNMLTCCNRGHELFKSMFSGDMMWLGCTDPGITLAHALRNALHEFSKRGEGAYPRAIFVENHGLIVCGDTGREIVENTQAVVDPIRKLIDSSEVMSADRPVLENPADVVSVVAPALRALLADGDALKIVAFDDSPCVMELACRSDGPDVLEAGPLTPDQIVYCESYPIWIELGDAREPRDVVEVLRKAVEAFRQKHSKPPKLVLVAGLGLFAIADAPGVARTAAKVYADATQIISGACRIGGVHHMPSKRRCFIETWEAEAYRRNMAARTVPDAGRAKGKIALVTGAAQGFGFEIARDLALQGAHVILADVNLEGAQARANDIAHQSGQGRAIAVKIDVTDTQSIAAAIKEAVRMFGGLDVFISNAGILRAASVYEQAERDFDMVTAVNYKAYFLCVQKVAPILAVQHIAKSDYRSDIIQINSKSGLEGSNKNFAYAGSKFGSIGLTQSFALELVENGIKVNSICPGNFFDGPLWSDPEKGLFVQYLRTGKVPGAKSVEDVKKAYESKVPMKRGCRTADVMKAIYYLMEQHYETGQALPVTGGQIMLN